MAKHLNNQISQLGRTAAETWLLRNGYDIMTDDEDRDMILVPVDNKGIPRHAPTEKELEAGYPESVEFTVVPCLLVIGTKKHDIQQGEKCTGLDVKRVQELQPKAEAHEIAKDVFCVFVDVRLGIVMGQMLSKLMAPTTLFGINWPLNQRTHTGEIYFFSIYQIPTLFKLDKDIVEKIGHLSAQNRVDKNQGYLFS